MEIKINVEKKHLVGFLVVFGIIAGLGVAFAGDFVGPSGIGHDIGEIDWASLGSCDAGSSISQINVDGTVVCEPDDVGGHTDGADCPPGQYARGVDANGVAMGCTMDNSGSVGRFTWDDVSKILVDGQDVVRSRWADTADTGGTCKVKLDVHRSGEQEKDALCPVGYKATGGGGWAEQGTVQLSYPKEDLSGWNVRFSNTGNFQRNVYAICCKDVFAEDVLFVDHV